MKNETTEICVRLLDEGTETVRPTQGVALGNNVYKLLPTSNYDPEDERWEFLPGSIVRCEKSNNYTKPCLLAVEEVD